MPEEVEWEGVHCNNERPDRWYTIIQFYILKVTGFNVINNSKESTQWIINNNKTYNRQQHMPK